MTRHSPILIIVAVLSIGAMRTAPAAERAMAITLPVQNTFFRPGPGVDIARRDCLSCHSAQYITTQPALPRAAWTKEIVKMRAAYGATIPDGDVDALLVYLVAQNPNSPK